MDPGEGKSRFLSARRRVTPELLLNFIFHIQLQLCPPQDICIGVGIQVLFQLPLLSRDNCLKKLNPQLALL